MIEYDTYNKTVAGFQDYIRNLLKRIKELEAERERLHAGYAERVIKIKATVDGATAHKELTAVVNRLGLEQQSDTPDFIIADFLYTCLFALHDAVNRREEWYGRRRPLTESEIDG